MTPKLHGNGTFKDEGGWWAQYGTDIYGPHIAKEKAEESLQALLVIEFIRDMGERFYE